VTALAASYATCRTLNARHGRTYFLATRLLPAGSRPAVHALYAFARVADDLVDGSMRSLDSLWEHPVVPAFRDTVDRYQIPPEHVDAFLGSMEQDLHVSSYATWEDLLGYSYGSAAVIGLMLLPVFGTVVDPSLAAPYAADLGNAFQLTNFLRDIGEDLDRGRLYLPLEDLDRFGVTRTSLERRVLDDCGRALLRFEITRARGLYAIAAQGIRLLSPAARPCVETALTLYAGILDEIEKADFPVLTRRVSVGPGKRLRVAVPALLSG
jgi:phytoene synthase